MKSLEGLSPLYPARPDEAPEIGTFVVNCLRDAFTKDVILGPQEMFKSADFLEAYKVYRLMSIQNPENICKVLRRSTSSGGGEGGEIVGYVEVGRKKEYRGLSGCEFEIICLFTSPDMKGRGIGTMLVSSAFREMAALGKLSVEKDRVGVMTLSGNPHIRFYEKMGAKQQGDHEMKWIGGFTVTGTALLLEANVVEELIKIGYS